jgi:O-acetyl-ADP-ribose deacetylase (regulator of RNase III)
MDVTINGCRLELVQGDITDQSTDAIVNAANSRLAGGGGVDGAIHRRGGRSIMKETHRHYPDGCPTGSAVASTAGDLSCRYVIHAVGPRYRDGQQGEPDLLRSAYRQSLQRALEMECHSVAFPSLSTGAYGYPIDSAAPLALDEVKRFLEERGQPELVRFVLFSEADLRVYEVALGAMVAA